MAWFKKSGGDDKKKKQPERAHDRVECHGETISIIWEAGGDGPSYPALDISLGGFAVSGYDGNLHGNQYFEFRFNGSLNNEEASVEGFANVVRVKNGMLAAKFPTQPRLKAFITNYIAHS